MRAPNFELPNVAAGPDPISLTDVASTPAVDAIVLLFQRDHHCRNCRRQVQMIAERHDEFLRANTHVVSILPEPIDRVTEWQSVYHLPFPLLADPQTEVSNAYEQPVRFGILGSLHDLIGRMPVPQILDCRTGEPELAYSYEGRMPADRPDVEELISKVHVIRNT